MENLRSFLKVVATSDLRVLPMKLGELTFDFRDRRLELIRRHPGSWSEMQLQELLQMEYRLQMARDGQGSWTAAQAQAQQTLQALVD